MRNTEFIIIGGGIIGMTTARELALKGAKVAIFDRGELGMEASWAAGGIISPMRPWAESAELVVLSEYSKRIYPKFIEELQQETGIEPEFITSGLVIIDEVHAEKTQKWAENREVKIQKNIDKNSPIINLPEYSITLPDIAQVHPPKLIKALRKSLEKLSVSIYENTEIKRLDIKGNLFQSVQFDKTKLFADSAIITAGAWSKMLLDNINMRIDTKPIRGQMLCLKSDEVITDKIILDDGHYFIPRKDGSLLVGSTMEDVGYNIETTKEARKQLLDWAVSMAPTLSQAKCVNQWSGLRPSTPSGKPIIGKIRDYDNIYLNTGHFRKGILQAPASAELIVDSILGNSSFMELKCFSIES